MGRYGNGGGSDASADSAECRELVWTCRPTSFQQRFVKNFPNHSKEARWSPPLFGGFAPPTAVHHFFAGLLHQLPRAAPLFQTKDSYEIFRHHRTDTKSWRQIAYKRTADENGALKMSSNSVRGVTLLGDYDCSQDFFWEAISPTSDSYATERTTDRSSVPAGQLNSSWSTERPNEALEKYPRGICTPLSSTREMRSTMIVLITAPANQIDETA